MWKVRGRKCSYTAKPDLRKASKMSREGGGMYCYGDERFPVDKQPLRLIG